VLTGEEAANVVRNAKYAPEGLRGIDGIEAHARHGLQPFEEYRMEANRETFVVVQIEDAQGVDNVDAIARTPGVDVLFVGPADLAASLGVVGQMAHARVQEATQRVAKAAADAGILWGSTVGNGERFEYLKERGATFFAWGAAIVGLLGYYQGIKREYDSRAGA
jgi:2-keto-3-deoxy-L-rhamnonate aldolase RhmA